MTSVLPSSDPLSGLQNQRSSLEITLDVLNRVRRRWWVAAFFFVAIPGYVIWHGLQRPILYSSSMTLMLEQRPPRIVDKVTEVVAEEVMADSDRFAAGQMRLLASEYLSDQVERRIGVGKGTLAGRLQATLEPRSHVVTLEVSDLDAQKAVTLVQAFAEAYIATTISERAGIASDATHFLGDEVKALAARLERDEQALYDFDRTNQLPASSFDESHKIASSKLETFHLQAAQARTTGIKLRAQLEAINAAKDNPDLLRMLTLPAAGETWSGPQSRYTQLLEQMRQLESHYGPQHPKVLEQNQALATIAGVLDREAHTAVPGHRVARAAEQERAGAAASGDRAAARSTASGQTDRVGERAVDVPPRARRPREGDAVAWIVNLLFDLEVSQ